MSLWYACRKLVFVVALIAATIVWAEPTAGASLKLAWKDNSTNETGFKIERLIGSTYLEIATVGANTVSYTDSSLNGGSTYCYRVRAFNTGSTSAPTNISCAVAPVKSSISAKSTGSTTMSPTPTIQLGSGSKWTDYRLSLRIRSSDDDVIGVMFRYQDRDNYYRFLWDAKGQLQKLEKKVGGVLAVLARQSGNSVGFRVGRTYTLEILAQGSSLRVNIDGTQIFSVTDTNLTKGTIALYSHANAGTIFDDVVVEDLFTHSLLLSDNFDDGNFVGWTIFDEGTIDGPSSWSAAGKALVQSSNIGSEDPEQFGTYALYTKGSWTDYRVTLKMRSNDSGALGVMFRFHDSNNFYRFSWDQERRLRQLAKRENGKFTTIAEDAVPYVSGRTYLLEIAVQGSAINVTVDESSVFAVSDTTFDKGTIGLYSCDNPGSAFDDVLVEDFSAGSQLLWDDFDDADFTGWTVIDEGDRDEPSAWTLANGALVQQSSIGSAGTGQCGTSVIY